MKVADRRRYGYRAIDQAGQVIDVFCPRGRMARRRARFFERAIGATKVILVEVLTDEAPTYPVVLVEIVAMACGKSAERRAASFRTRQWSTASGRHKENAYLYAV